MAAGAVWGVVQLVQAAVPSEQEAFFQQVNQGTASGLLGKMRSDLRLKVDEPVLAAWMQAFNDRLGQIEEITLNSFVVRQSTDGGLYRKSVCTVQCISGVARSEITTVDGQIVSFQVDSDQLQDWFEGPASTGLYERTGQKFIEQLLSDDPASAYALCHPALQQAIELDDFTAIGRSVRSGTGPVRETKMAAHRMESDAGSGSLFLDFTVAGEHGTKACEIEFQFANLQGHLVGFAFRNP
jgi:hypothetical protein